MPQTRDENPTTIKLGGTLEICRLGFGTIHLTNGRGFGQPRASARELLRQAAEMGVNFFDTADSYGPEHAEHVIREALHPYNDIVIATKGGYEHGLEDDWRENGSPEHLRNALEGSLKRLDLERIDLYQLHTPDPMVPYEESLGALKDFHDEGKIRYVGVSRVNLDQLRQAQEILGDRLVSVQNCYNVFYHQGYGRYQEPDNENILSLCEREGFVFIAWEPLASGSIEPGVLDDSLLRELALRHRVTVQRVMLAALLQRSEVIMPIPGTSKIDHLRFQTSLFSSAQNP